MNQQTIDENKTLFTISKDFENKTSKKRLMDLLKL
jgi:hypothetical protein